MKSHRFVDVVIHQYNTIFLINSVLPYVVRRGLDGLGENVFICKLMYADFYNLEYTRINVQLCLN